MKKIICFFADPKKKRRAVSGLSGLTLKEAQEICSNPESSSRTAKSKTAKRRTKEHGDWFYGYVEDD